MRAISVKLYIISCRKGQKNQDRRLTFDVGMINQIEISNVPVFA